ncbi:hypothetical protein MLD52_08345 [Puniceicoccaceae bacterium K14]|nr:hypothetical protein [Puniceicoccaceae bacterium K14]
MSSKRLLLRGDWHGIPFLTQMPCDLDLTNPANNCSIEHYLPDDPKLGRKCFIEFVHEFDLNNEQEEYFKTELRRNKDKVIT